MGNSEQKQQEPVKKESQNDIYAVCILRQDNNSGVNGMVRFQQSGAETRITSSITGLKQGKHGFHIHEFGNLIEGCKSAGGHYNPLGKTHGGPSLEERHVGDLGNIYSDGVNPATYDLVDKLIQLQGPHSIIGRSCVVHADEDDLGQGGQEDSKTTGHAGARLACGTVGISMKF